MIGRLAAFFLLSAIVAQAAEIKGKITSVVGGEGLGRVQVSVLEAGVATTTSVDGAFVIQNLAPGNYTLRLNAVGYRLVTVPFSLSTAQDVKEFSISMAPDTFRRTEIVEVNGDVFQGGDPPSMNEINLVASEIKETSTVLADDPFRAIQALPGVSASGNDEFFAQFSVMGAPFRHVAVYIDDVLVSRPFHDIPGESGASSSVLASDTVEEMKLLPVAYPPKYGDATGAAVDIRTRDGSRTAPLFRLSVGLAESEFLGEGRLGSTKRGSWLASVRKSYLGYLLRSRLDSFTDVSFYDANLKFTYDLAHNHNLNFYALGGHTDANVPSRASPLDINDFKKGTSDFILSRVGWRWAITSHLLLDTHAAYIRSPFENRNSLKQVLVTDDYGEWVGGTSVAWNWKKDQVLEAGWTARRLRDSGYSAFYGLTGPESRTQFGVSNGTGLRQSVYAQGAFTFWKDRVHVLGGLRGDSQQQIGVHQFSPQISVSMRAAPSTHLQFGFGRYAQFPDFRQLAGDCSFVGQLLRTANHFTAGVEQRLGEYARIRVQAFDRQNENLVGSRNPFSCGPLRPPTAPYLRDYSRGVQLILQRRSANRLSGWLGYTLTFARQRVLSILLPGAPLFFTSPYVPTFEDQRHSLNAVASYRLTPTINLGGKWLYGSGFPIPSGFYALVGNTFVPVGLNQVRLSPYERLDLRVDKSCAFTHWKLTLYGEVLNVTNHNNRRFVTSTIINPSTGQTFIQTRRGLPITPTAGLVFEF